MNGLQGYVGHCLWGGLPLRISDPELMLYLSYRCCNNYIYLFTNGSDIDLKVETAIGPYFYYNYCFGLYSFYILFLMLWSFATLTSEKEFDGLSSL